MGRKGRKGRQWRREASSREAVSSSFPLFPCPPPPLPSSLSMSVFASSPRRLSFQRTRRARFPSSSISSSASSPLSTMASMDDLKRMTAHKAVEAVKSGMIVGLGTGSTAAFAVSRLGELLKSGALKDVVGIPTSKATEEQARSLGIPLGTLDEYPSLDLAIDGADEVDTQLGLVKGRGGALLREKMVEAAASEFIVIVDESKLVDGLGGSKLAMPVEIVQFCHDSLRLQLESLPSVSGCKAVLRPSDTDKEKPYITDNGNYIVDLFFEKPMENPEKAAEEISSIVGVVEHGLFLGMATSCVVAGAEGVYEIQA